MKIFDAIDNPDGSIKPVVYTDADMDDNIRALVNELNLFPGVRTIGSCGGHENPNEWQHPKGEWYVTFRISLKAGGWQSLERLASAYMFIEGISIEAVSNCAGHPTGRTLWFMLNGKGSDPEEIAVFMKALRTLTFEEMLEVEHEYAAPASDDGSAS